MRTEQDILDKIEEIEIRKKKAFEIYMNSTNEKEQQAAIDFTVVAINKIKLLRWVLK